jgi:hypothetical protein
MVKNVFDGHLHETFEVKLKAFDLKSRVSRSSVLQKVQSKHAHNNLLERESPPSISAEQVATFCGNLFSSSFHACNQNFLFPFSSTR